MVRTTISATATDVAYLRSEAQKRGWSLSQMLLQCALIYSRSSFRRDGKQAQCSLRSYRPRAKKGETPLKRVHFTLSESDYDYLTAIAYKKRLSLSYFMHAAIAHNLQQRSSISLIAKRRVATTVPFHLSFRSSQLTFH